MKCKLIASVVDFYGKRQSDASREAAFTENPGKLSQVPLPKGVISV
jgi:hypothetical protein